MKKKSIFIGLFSLILVFVILVKLSFSFHVYHQYIGSYLDIFCVREIANKSHSLTSLNFFKDIRKFFIYSNEKFYCIFIMRDNDIFYYPVYCFVPGRNRLFRINLMKGPLVSKLAYIVLNKEQKDITTLLIEEKEFMTELFRKLYNNELKVDVFLDMNRRKR